MSNQIFRRISHIRGMPVVAVATHYTPEPPQFFFYYQSMFSTEPLFISLRSGPSQFFNHLNLPELLNFLIFLLSYLPQILNYSIAAEVLN